ncbi:hypothetical protein MPLB_1380038 [Mesorhizobium sp. ORS 3324]|nr:hypothetical protein MPLB_1380038 [Mesorhizobium sp. ORS 3324]
MLIKAHGAKVHKPCRVSAEISGLVVNGWAILWCAATKILQCTKFAFILPSYMNETAFCQSRCR